MIWFRRHRKTCPCLRGGLIIRVEGNKRTSATIDGVKVYPQRDETADEFQARVKKASKGGMIMVFEDA